MLCPASLLNEIEQASQAELVHQGALSYLEKFYIFEIPAKNHSKYQSSVQIQNFLLKMGIPSVSTFKLSLFCHVSLHFFHACMFCCRSCDKRFECSTETRMDM